MSSFASLWDDIADLGRAPSGGYRRFAWTPEDAALREWFAGAAAARGLETVVDRAGNQSAWWGDPDACPKVVLGSHLDSVPDGGAFDGPLGVVSAFAALDSLRAQGIHPARPLGIVNFTDEEGARFGVACTGSRLITGALDPDREPCATATAPPWPTRWRAQGRTRRRSPRTLMHCGAWLPSSNCTSSKDVAWPTLDAR